MKKISTILLLTAFILGIGACSISQDYHFNKDFSGSVKNSIDLTSMIGFMQMSDSTANTENFKDSLNLEMDKLKQKIKEAGGKNPSYGWNDEGTIVHFQYKFPNLETLNNIIQNTGSSETLTGTESESSKNGWFEKSGRKTLIYHPAAAELGEEGLGEAEQYKDMYSYEINFSFERKIKSVSSDSVMIEESKHSAVLKGSLFDMYNKEFQKEIVFKLK